MNNKRFEKFKSDITDYRIYDYEKEDAYFIDCDDESTVDAIVDLLNRQQTLIGQYQKENLYKNFKLKSIDDLKKLKDIFEICMILIDGAIADEDLELGYESVFQFEKRIKKFNGDINEL